ncbi:hypothetical protein LQE92_08840 [Lacrimispora sp. NSJ-141]|uniref:Uncharacterized protein n=1 Tax=Lientehia hominis TaxID=2897778 RepID=A0AAP2W7S1_9FIRM|nr:hypothetical protein [Lientehia hominis]MCD2492733.1 hypothetical protein [Lientehia hominis]
MEWKTIYRHLKEAGYEVYSLGQHKGDCTSPYLVLRNNGAGLDHSVSVQEYEILLYYPVNRYSEFEGYIDGVRTCMNSLYPHVTLVDDQQPHYPDDDVKAYMTSLIYQVQKVSNVNRF